MRTSRETIGERTTTHGHTRGRKQSPAYRSWNKAKQRCFYPGCDKYEFYGGRGITMVPEWADSFAAFHRDMGDPPRGLTLDRIDVNGNYAPGNCRWATKSTQMANTRSNVHLEHRGERLTLAQWARRLGMDPRNFYRDWKYQGRSLEEIIARRQALGYQVAITGPTAQFPELRPDRPGFEVTLEIAEAAPGPAQVHGHHQEAKS